MKITMNYPLLDLLIDLIKYFRTDYMQNSCLEIMKLLCVHGLKIH